MGRPIINNDNRTYVQAPSHVTVTEDRAPTDESIRLMGEVHEKVLDNIIAKVKVNENLIKGEAFLINNYMAIDSYTIVCKMVINGREIIVKREILGKDIPYNKLPFLENSAKSIILWYLLQMFVPVAYEQLSGEKFPENLLPK